MSTATAPMRTRTQEAPRRRTMSMLPLATILLAPTVGVALLRAPLMTVTPYPDSWFYSSYAWSLAHNIEIFGWFYYSVRFPAILPLQGATKLFGPVAAYLIVHYLILAGTGAVVYRVVRRATSTTIAVVATILLAANPFYLRLVLWDYVSFVALPCTIAGTLIWVAASTSGRRWWWFALSGAFLGAAVFSNGLAIFVLPTIAAVEVIAALRARVIPLGAWVVRTLAAAGGGVVVLGLGYLGYRISLGDFSPRDLLRPTLEFVRNSDQSAAPFRRPVGQWIDGEPRIWAPVLSVVAMVISMGPRALLATDLRARLAQVAVGYLATFWGVRFLSSTNSVIETWWAYSMVALSMCLAGPLTLDALVHRAGERGTALRIIVPGAAGIVGTGLIVRSFDPDVIDLYDSVRQHPAILVVLIVAAVATAVLARAARSSWMTGGAIAASLAIGAFLALTPADYIGIRKTGEFAQNGSMEIKAYGAAYDLTKMVARTDQPQARTLPWSSLVGPTAIAWVNLPHQQGGLEVPEQSVPLPRLEPAQLALLRFPTTRRVLVFSENAADLPRARAALNVRDLDTIVEQRGTWGDGLLHYWLLELAR